MTTGRRATLTMALAATALVVAGCAASKDQVLLVSGNTLTAIGEQFVAVAPAMKSAHDVQHLLSDDEYAQWTTFAAKFKVTFHLAVQLWSEAQGAGDIQTANDVTVIIQRLGNELAMFIAKLHPPSGAP